jgi:hypothetical protein
MRKYIDHILKWYYDRNGEITEEFILKKNLIGYLNLVLLKKLFQRIGYKF